MNFDLNKNEAIVLFELLSREERKINTLHYAEKKIIWKILGQLEKELAEPFKTDYTDLLENARKEVQGLDEV